MTSKDQDIDDTTTQDDEENEDGTLKTDPNTVTKLSPGVIAGIVVAVIVVVIVIVIGVVLGTMNPNASSSASSGSSSGTASGSATASGSISDTTTQFLLGTFVRGTPQTFPGTAPINGPIISTLPDDFGTNPNSTAYFVFNQNGDSLANPIFGTFFDYNAPSNSISASSALAPTGDVVLGLVGYALTPQAMSSPIDPFVPYCSSMLATLLATSSTNFTITIPITLPGNPDDFFAYVQNGDITANSILVTAATITNPTTITISYINGTVASCRLNIIIVARTTTIPNQNATRLLFATNTVVSSIIPATLTVNVPLSTAITQSSTVNPIWFAINQTMNTSTIIFSVRQTSPTNLRVLLTATTNPTSFCFFAINANDLSNDFTFN